MKPAEKYILNQPKEYQEIIYYVCSVIAQEFPETKMLFKWKVPFYYLGKRPFFYINANHKRKIVDVAFVCGNKLKSHQNYLKLENRTQIKSLQYFQSDTIPDEVLRDVINEAKTFYKQL